MQLSEKMQGIQFPVVNWSESNIAACSNDVPPARRDALPRNVRNRAFFNGRPREITPSFPGRENVSEITPSPPSEDSSFVEARRSTTGLFSSSRNGNGGCRRIEIAGENPDRFREEMEIRKGNYKALSPLSIMTQFNRPSIFITPRNNSTDKRKISLSKKCYT